MEEATKTCINGYLSLFSSFKHLPQYVLDQQSASLKFCDHLHRGSPNHKREISDIFEQMQAFSRLNDVEREVRQLRLNTRRREFRPINFEAPPPSRGKLTARPSTSVKVEHSFGKIRVKAEPIVTLPPTVPEVINVESDEEESPTIVTIPISTYEELQADNARYQELIGIYTRIFFIIIFFLDE